MDRPYSERLEEVEELFAKMEVHYTIVKAKLAKVLRDRPCDFYLEHKGKVWIQYRTTRGERGGFGWSNVDPYHKAVWTGKRQTEAEGYAKYLEQLKGIDRIEVKERPIVQAG